MHIQVTHGAGDLTQPAELLFEMGGVGRWKYPLHLAQQGTGAADGDAVIVQKFTIDIGLQPRLVGQHGLIELLQDVSAGLIGTGLRVQFNVQLGTVVVSAQPLLCQRIEQTIGTGYTKLKCLHQFLSDSVIGRVIALHGLDDQPARQGLALLPWQDDIIPLHTQHGDGLSFLVDNAEAIFPAFQFGHWQKRTHLDDRFKILAQRRPGQFPGEFGHLGKRDRGVGQITR